MVLTNLVSIFLKLASNLTHNCGTGFSLANLRIDRWEGIYCRCEGEYENKHLEESRTGRGSSKLNKTSRLHCASKGEQERRTKERREEENQKTNGVHGQVAGFYRKEELGEGKPMELWVGMGWEELREATGTDWTWRPAGISFCLQFSPRASFPIYRVPPPVYRSSNIGLKRGVAWRECRINDLASGMRCSLFLFTKFPLPVLIIYTQFPTICSNLEQIVWGLTVSENE